MENQAICLPLCSPAQLVNYIQSALQRIKEMREIDFIDNVEAKNAEYVLWSMEEVNANEMELV